MRLTPITALAAAAATAWAAPAAAESFEPPEGCAGFLTVQMRGCMVSNHFVCEADPEGWRRHVTFRANGPSGASIVDREYQWLESYGATRQERLALPTPDPASLTELFEKGEDTYDFTVIDMGGEEPVESRVVGVDRLEGGTEVIDGQELKRTAFAFRKLDAEGEETISATGAQFVSEDHRLFFPGTETVRVGGRTLDFDNTPVRFIEPGEPGFFDARPLFGCEVSDAAFR